MLAMHGFEVGAEVVKARDEVREIGGVPTIPYSGVQVISPCSCPLAKHQAPQQEEKMTETTAKQDAAQISCQ